MKKFSLLLTVVGFVLIPTLLLAQPPRPRYHPQIAQPIQNARPTMQVHVPPQAVHNSYYGPHRPPVAPQHTPNASFYRPPMYPPVVRPQVVVVPQVIAPPPVIAPAVVVPGYYPPMTSGFSLTIGGQNGVFSIATGR